MCFLKEEKKKLEDIGGYRWFFGKEGREEEEDGPVSEYSSEFSSSSMDDGPG